MTITRERLEAAKRYVNDPLFLASLGHASGLFPLEEVNEALQTLIDAKTAPTNYDHDQMPNGEFVGEVYWLTHKVIDALENPTVSNEQFMAVEKIIRDYVWSCCKRALQENTAPDDSVKQSHGADVEAAIANAYLREDDSDIVEALEYYADRKFWSNRRDHHGGYSIFERDTNGYEVAEKALKGRKCSKCQQ